MEGFNIQRLTLILLALAVARPAPPAEPPASPIRFRNVAASSGLDFVLDNYSTPEKNMIEMMTGGVVTFDYDGDGNSDVYFVNGSVIPSMEKESPKFYNRLYHNKGGFQFEDVTEQAGVKGAGYSMGAAAADYDNDGDTDLFVAGVHRNTLYRNNGDGTFTDVTTAAGIKSDLWSVAAGWFDYDNDGNLDLFVANYAEWTPSYDRFCGDAVRKIRVYCHPKYFKPLPNQLYHGRGDGTFEDVSESSGIAEFRGRAMGIAIADYDNDGLSDVFITNDNLPNFLFHNLGGGAFEEVGLLAGVALLDNGKPIASMGTDFRDFDNDGLPDIQVVALTGETFPLFKNFGDGMFQDMTYMTHMGPESTNSAGWGPAYVDLDNDGWKDLFVTGSHVNDIVELFEATTYKQPNHVFANNHDGTFRNVSKQAFGDDAKAQAHRGSAFADFNHDGKLDVVVSVIGEPAELWENTSETGNSWLILKLIGVKSNRDGIGAKVRIGDQYNHMTTAFSYSSSTDIGVHFGLGKVKVAPEIEIRWPSGIKQVLRDVELNRVLEVRESGDPEVSLKAR